MRRRWARLAGSLAVVGMMVAASSGVVGASSTAGVKPFPKYPKPASGNGGSNGQTGVTGTSITVGSVIGAGTGVSNAQIGAYDGARAYFDMVDASGGIYGRKIHTTEMNTTFTGNVATGIYEKYIPKLFATVGNASEVYYPGTTLVKKTGITWVGGGTAVSWYTFPNLVPCCTGLDVPYGEAANGEDVIFKKLEPKISKVAVIWVNVGSLKAAVNEFVKAWESVGVKVVYNVGIPGTVTNLTPYVIKARSTGANVLTAAFEDITEVGRLAEAVKEQGWNPLLKLNYSVYDPSFHKLAGAAAAGWMTGTPLEPYLPWLTKKKMDSTVGGAQLLQWTKKIGVPASTIDVFTMVGWVQAAFFVEGLVKAGPHLTRAKLETALRSIKHFDATGVQPTVDPAGAKGVVPKNYCADVSEATTTGFKQVYPKTGDFGCVSQKSYHYTTKAGL